MTKVREFERNGWGLYAVELKSNGTFIGYVGLKIIDRGIPIPQKERDTWIDNISDHFPYSVKLKVQ